MAHIREFERNSEEKWDVEKLDKDLDYIEQTSEYFPLPENIVE